MAAASTYVVSFAALAIFSISIVAVAEIVRRTYLPGVTPRPLATGVLSVLGTVLLAEGLGTLGMLNRPALVAGVLIAVYAALTLRRHRRATTSSQAPPQGAPPTSALVASLLAGGVAATAVVADWTDRTLHTVQDGFADYDSLWYHLPFAARYAQDQATTGLPFTGNGPTSFYPQNAEVLHSVGMLLTEQDVLSAVANMGWLGLAIAAGWSVGRPFGQAPLAATAIALVCATGPMAIFQPGTANNDIVALALLLSGAAFLVAQPRDRRAAVLTGVCCGLAAGTRLNYLLPALAMLAASTALCGPRRRLRILSSAAAGAAAGGGYWFLKNAVIAQNPLPFFSFRLPVVGGLPTTSDPVDCGRRSLAGVLDSPDFVRAHIVPQVPRDLAVVGVLAVAGIVLGVRSQRAEVRVLAILAAVAAAGYLVTPATAGGTDASCFRYNTRFVVPAVALGLLALCGVLSTRRLPVNGTAVAFAVLASVFVGERGVRPNVLSVVLVGVATFSLAAWLARKHVLASLSRRRQGAAGTVAFVVAATAWFALVNLYNNRDWTNVSTYEPSAKISRLLRDGSERVAVDGLFQGYHFSGRRQQRVVRYLNARDNGPTFPPIRTCEAWVRALQLGKFDRVVIGAEGRVLPPSARWTAAHPRASQVERSPADFRTAQGTPFVWVVYRLDGPADVASPDQCGSADRDLRR